MVALVLVACGDDDGIGPADLGATPDAFVEESDGGSIDGGVPADGALPSDAAPTDAAPPDLGPPPRGIVLGTGQLDWEPLPADGTLELVQGSQGGVHLTLALQLWDLDPDRMWLRYRGFLAETGEEVFTPTERIIGRGGVLLKDDHLVRAGDRLVLDELLLPRGELIGQDVRIEAVAEPETGEPVHASVVVTVVDEV